MNIELANTIPMSEFLSKLGFEPTKIKGDEYWYLSPLRNEKTASFHVNNKKNIWFDFGENAGGNMVSFACAYLKSQENGHAVSDALRFIKNIAGYARIAPVAVPDYSKKDCALTVKTKNSIKHPGLIDYIKNTRGISLETASKYLRQLYIFNANSGKSFYALGLKNEDGGYELRNPFFKGSVAPKNITFIRGTKPKPPSINIFEGTFDYLSAIEQRGGEPFEDDTIILNSLSNMDAGTAYIRGYGYEMAYTWLDNDEAGEKATKAFAEFFKTEPGLRHKAMNKHYKPHKDVNASHIAKLGLGC